MTPNIRNLDKTLGDEISILVGGHFANVERS